MTLVIAKTRRGSALRNFGLAVAGAAALSLSAGGASSAPGPVRSLPERTSQTIPSAVVKMAVGGPNVSTEGLVKVARKGRGGFRGRGFRGGRGLRGRAFRAGRGFRGPRFRGRHYGRPYYGRRFYRRRHHGVGVAAGIAGLLIGGAIVASQRDYGSRWEACDRRYRTFRWSDGTYIPYAGGPRELCPYLRR